MRSLLIIVCVSTILASCSSTKVVPATTAGIAPPPTASTPPQVEKGYKRVNYIDSSSNGSITIRPQEGNMLVLEHVTVAGKLAPDQGQPIIRLTIWQNNGESLEHKLSFSMKGDGYIYDSDVFHRLQPGQHAMIEIFNPESGDVYEAKIKTSGYQETK